MSGAIFPFDVVYVGPPAIVTTQKVNKQVTVESEKMLYTIYKARALYGVQELSGQIFEDLHQSS